MMIPCSKLSIQVCQEEIWRVVFSKHSPWSRRPGLQNLQNHCPWSETCEKDFQASRWDFATETSFWGGLVVTEEQNNSEKNVHNLMKLVGLLDIFIKFPFVNCRYIITFPYAKVLNFLLLIFFFPTRLSIRYLLTAYFVSSINSETQFRICLLVCILSERALDLSWRKDPHVYSCFLNFLYAKIFHCVCKRKIHNLLVS